MTYLQRINKRLIIIFVYLIIISLIGTGFYFFFRTKPNCSDKIQNQGETDVDCGGPCKECEEKPVAENLKIIEASIVSGENGSYDGLVKITNPNSQLGAAALSYSFNFLDETKRVVAKKEGSSFILPGQTKYILAFNVPAEAKVDSLDFHINSFEWSKFSEFESPNIAVYAKEFNLSGGGEPGFANLKAKIRNQSGYDFREVSAVAVIRDGSGLPVAINETNFNDVRANEEREISFSWNTPFPIDPVSAKIEIIPESDVFKDENFLKAHGTPGQYGTYNADSQ